jgi:excisionase family DNA binding protein
MKTRRPNPRLVKIHRSYTVEEIAALFGIHKNTVRDWIKKGLPVCDARRPVLILGQVLRDYLQAKRTRNKRTCLPGELYCLRCREPRKPAGEMADFQPVTPKVGNLIAICPVCDAMMNKRVSMARLEQIRAQIDITFTQALKHIGDSSLPTLNSDFQ